MYLHMPENKQRNTGHLSCKTASEQFNPVTFSDDKRYLRAKCKTNAWPSNVTISFQNLEDERYSVLCFETISAVDALLFLPKRHSYRL